MRKGHEKLVRATMGDADAVRSLVRSAYAKWIPVIGREPKPMGADYEHAVQHHLVDLLYADGELAGLIEMIRETGCLLIENVAVAPAFQGRGYGRLLLTHAEALAGSLGLREIRLYTNKMFAENIALYLKLGYTIDREEPFLGGIAVHMRKPIPRYA
ncbi:GNAT family N-acetyltransferase [Phyllobacterium myrsinacearum]|uniref:GNAT family N-acetyltransferase n=1 Tax=Phyllobacterium myrsinacearum TaxID=28101 RepID=A0A2S9JJZ5_9HYPH|nr:GNAT family N-acetyltransferase [Phyllobacterium myrsinacearum]PRD53429.1 GNAT family N-acetyltransferase [Phyllobacterium myrsinacearum]PWV87779.1 acetyltransferase (GNAT) family protein [Phyllobacterium myrsinacearum]RZV07877.1 acetyltransferase (GNAT) family protein [Phyllobacterium myrsinacearum]